MESCRPAIIVSFGVTAHWRPKRASVQQESIPWQSFVGCLTEVSFDSPRFETSRSVPVKGDRAMTIFIFLTTRRRRSVPIDLGFADLTGNWVCLLNHLQINRYLKFNPGRT
jgi:hypothetical protein